MNAIVTPGVCRICGCTETTPCLMGVEPCAWIDLARTLCSNPRCVAEMSLDELLAMIGVAA